MPSSTRMTLADAHALAAHFLADRQARHGTLRMEADDGTGDGAQAGGDTGQSGDQTGQQTGGIGHMAGAILGDQASPQAGTWDGKVESLPEPVQKMIRDLRQENGQRRTALTAAEQQQQAMVRAFAQAAGIQLPDDQPDPGKLTEQLTAAQQAQRQTAVELAVYRTAAKHQGDPDALLDSRAFLTKVADLDPTAGDFADKVDAAIKDAVTSNPKLKTTRTPGASGADHAGGSGEGPRKPQSLEEAVALKLGA